MSDPALDRRISGKSFLGHYLAAFLAGVLCVGAAAALGAGGSLPVFLIAPLPLLATFAYSYLARAGTAYRLFADRLEIESGLFSRQIENVELFRVRDVGLRQGLFGRMMNFGDIYIHSTDSSTPDLHVRGIEAPQEFYRQLREFVSTSRAQGRTLIVEEGQAIPEP